MIHAAFDHFAIFPSARSDSVASTASTSGVRADVGDDFGDTALTAGRLTDKVPLSGNLGFFDRDSFRFNVVAGNSYVIEMTIPVSEGSTPLFVQGTSGESLPLHSIGGLKPGFHYSVFEATSSGDYLITIDGRDGRATGSYVVSAYSVSKDDFGHGWETAGVLDIGAQISGNIERLGDEDFFRVSVTKGKSYLFELLGSAQGGGTLTTTDGSFFRLMNSATWPAGLPAPGDHPAPRILFTAQDTRDFLLQVSGSSRNAGSYTVKATEVIGDTTAPTVANQSIAHDAHGVSLTAELTLIFNEPIRFRGEGIWLEDSSGTVVPIDIADLRQSWAGISYKVGIDPLAPLRPGTTYTVWMLEGSVLDRVGNPYVGPKSISFTTMPVATSASSGNDLLAGLGQGRTIAGGTGIDTVLYNDTITSYRVVRSNGDTTVSHHTAIAGDSLSGIERLLFADGAMALDIGGTAGQAYRLYQAAFDRVPDKDGLGYWIAQMDSGMALAEVASGFVSSNEFKALYGTAPNNAQFVDLLYDNVLHRKGDQAGIDYWMNSLSVGAKREDMLASFSESAENQAAMAAVIGNGFIYNPYG